ncbi:MAG: ATP-binding protein [Pyrinomonadaceae bacterium]
MRTVGRKIGIDLRTKLLVMLALVSLPLLALSLFQLHSYQQHLTEQAATIARIETAAAEGALDSWLRTHLEVTTRDTPLDPTLAADLYGWVDRHASLLNDSIVIVYDAQGRFVPRPSARPLAAPLASPAGAQAAISDEVGKQPWSDGVSRLTSIRRIGKWAVAVGVPLPESTPAGRSVLVLTSVWALALLASSLLSFWAVRRLTKPLSQLAASAAALGEGNLQERAAVQTDDEVGALASDFNQMASRLEHKFNELREQSAFIEEVLDSLPLGVAVLDASLLVCRANSTFARIVGAGDEKSLTNRKLYEAAAGLSALSGVIDDVRRTRRAFVNYGLPLDLGAEREPGQGAKYWDLILWPTSVRGEGRGEMLLIIAEVSNRVRAEMLATAAFAAEKARAAELESIINQMEEGVIIVDGRGRYRVNPAAARIIERQPGEFRDGVEALIADMALRDLQGRLLDAAETPLGRALERGEHVSGEHLQIVRGPNCEEGVLSVSATPLVGEEGRSEGVVAVFRDITGEVTQYRELMDAYSRLREHDRLKSAFVANVSHELRTPLNVIIGLCQLLARDRQLPLAPLQGESVGRMERNARSLLELVNDLLDYSRLEAGRSALRLTNVDVSEVIGEIVAEYSGAAAAKNLALRAEVSTALQHVHTDRHRLAQVLSNLVSNAIKFTPSGEIRIDAAPAETGHWSLEVSDTGIGISPEAVSYIFDGFRQVDDRMTRPYSGVGLGLAITRKIVELLEGEIKVESRLDAGSRFRITWPRAARPRTGTGSLVQPGASASNTPPVVPAPAPIKPLRARAGR